MRPAHQPRTASLLVLGLALGSLFPGLGGLVPGGRIACAEGAQQTSAELHALARRAAVIFSGQVVAIRRIPVPGDAQDSSRGTVEIDFAVDDAVRGLPAHASAYTLCEWAGLWSNGAAPFRIGQRYLMLLHAPGRAGLSSPVGGDDGAIPILAAAAAAGSPRVDSPQLDSPQLDSTPAGSVQAAAAHQPVLDLRWIAARVVRPAASQLAPLARPAVEPAVRSSVPPDGESGADADPAAGLTSDSAGHSADLHAVLTLLHAWQKADHAAH